MDPSECPGGSVVSLTNKGHWGWEQSRQGTYPGVGVEELLSGAGWGRGGAGHRCEPAADKICTQGWPHPGLRLPVG